MGNEETEIMTWSLRRMVIYRRERSASSENSRQKIRGEEEVEETWRRCVDSGVFLR